MEINQEQILTRFKVKKRSSERGDLIGELYEFYLSEKKDRRIENWKRYVKYCKQIKLLNPEDFKKVRQPKELKYIKELTIREFAIMLGHLKEKKDLYYLISVAKDIKNRGGNVSKYLLGSTHNQVINN